MPLVFKHLVENENEEKGENDQHANRYGCCPMNLADKSGHQVEQVMVVHVKVSLVGLLDQSSS